MRIEQREQLQSFLHSVRQEGVFDSEGCFTLNRHQAAGKLAAFLLPPGYWALKLVQAACLAQSESMVFRQADRSITLDLELGRPLDHFVFLNSLLHPSLEMGWVAQLAQGLRGIGESRSWLATLESQGRTTQTASNGGELSSETTSECLYKGFGTRLRVTVEPASPGLEVDLLRARALASSVPLTVQGARVDHLQFGTEGSGRARTFPIGAHWVTSPHRNGLIIPPGVRDTGHWYYVPAFTANSRVNRMLTAHFHYISCRGGLDVRGWPVSSSLHMVRHGVVVKTMDLCLHHPISVDLYLFADDPYLDVTGLQARAPQGLVQQAEEEVTAFNASLRELARQLGQGGWKPERSQLLSWVGAGALSLAVAPLLLPLIVMSATGWVAKQKNSSHRVRYRAADALESFRRKLPIVIRRG